VRILLVDDHQMMRDGVRAALERESDLRVVGETGDGQEALELCGSLHPDIVIMDVGMPGLNGVEATRRLTARHFRGRVVALSMNTDRRYVQAMFQAGAWAYLLKSAPPEELVLALRAVARGEKYVSPSLSGAVLAALAEIPSGQPGAAAKPELSNREREVLQFVAEGLTSKEIAVRLSIAVSTVETHRKALMTKLELRSVAELTKFAIRAGLTTLQ
jgi:DNA-binding NarL/FixJ family response regulator